MFHSRLSSIAICIFLLTANGPMTLAHDEAASIRWPEGFDFTRSIMQEEYALGDFLQWNFDHINDSKREDTYGLALANLTLGLLLHDPDYIVMAKAFFQENSISGSNSEEIEPSIRGFNYAKYILAGQYPIGNEIETVLEPIVMEKHALAKENIKKITIGKSSIKVDKDSLIKVQVDRVTRDWLQAYNIKSSPWAFSLDSVTDWHEGQKIRELIELTGAKVFPVSGTKVKKLDNRWYAPDSEGNYRFEVSEDKVLHFPTSIVIDENTAIINETHGISAIAWNSTDADLVIGCGDSLGKMDAAYYLAEKGVNVYVPTDRYIGTLLGIKTEGMIIGTAPVKKSEDGAIIGDQPITFDIDETIVVSNSDGGYPLQYYDTPNRYFKELERYIGKTLNIIPVDVLQYGKGDNVIEKAIELDATLIGMRVKSKQEHDAVYTWLKEDKDRRAILFHTAVYPDGYKLFYEFPEQTSFGDIYPEFE